MISKASLVVLVAVATAQVASASSAESLGRAWRPRQTGLVDTSKWVDSLETCLKTIDQSVQIASTACLTSIDTSIKTSSGLAEAAITGWELELNNLENEYTAYNATLVQCEQENGGLDQEAAGLLEDAVSCAMSAGAQTQAVVQQLVGLQTQAEGVVQSAIKSVTDCGTLGPFSELPCLLTSQAFPLCVQSASLAFNSSWLCASVASTAWQIPVKGSACMASAVAKRTAEVRTLLSNIRQCVSSSNGKPQTTTRATPGITWPPFTIPKNFTWPTLVPTAPASSSSSSSSPLSVVSDALAGLNPGSTSRPLLSNLLR